MRQDTTGITIKDAIIETEDMFAVNIGGILWWFYKSSN